MLRSLSVLALVVVFAGRPALAEEKPRDLRAVPLPRGWVEWVTEHGPAVVDTIKKRLNVEIDRVTMRLVEVNGVRITVNIVTAPNETAAKEVFKKLAHMRGVDFVRRVGREIVEVAKSNALTASRAFHWLGIENQVEAHYEMKARLGLVDKLDYMQANPFFNYMLNPDDPARKPAADVVKTWKMGNTLRLLAGPKPGHSAKYSFVALPATTTKEGANKVFTFRDPPRWNELLPFADVSASVRSTSRFEPVAVPGDEGSTAATAWWPADDELIIALARRLTTEAWTPRERVTKLLHYVHRKLKYEGATGSRWGVRKVLKQGFGHCWDKSDVLITMCRALGIPARQLAGWVPTMKSGHVWAEVKLGDEGWIPVDATTPWLGTSHHYITLFQSDDGHMPIIHMRWPEVVERKRTETAGR